MPIALDPKESFPLSLERDRAMPEGERPAFRFHYLTSREYRLHQALFNRIDAYYSQPREVRRDAAVHEAIIAELYALLAAQCVGWVNLRDRQGQELRFADNPLDALLTDPEAYELLTGALRMSELSVTEKNASGSPSASPTDAAAAGAAAAETARTGQPH